MDKIIIKNLDTKAPEGLKKKDVKKEFASLQEEIGELCTRLFAEGKRSLLCVFQGMDSSGKDGTTKNVFRFVPPSMLTVTPFGKPTKEEAGHDFLWRIHKVAPKRGDTAVFTRSHYEDVLIQRVHKWIDEDMVEKRFKAINSFEHHLTQHGDTTILKFFLNLSHSRQEEKLQERIDNLDKNWKHNPGDWEERKRWDDYMKCYEDVLNHCNKVPWHPVPCDDRWYRNYYVAKIVKETLADMNPQYPAIEK